MQNIASIASMTFNALSMGAALTDHQSTAHAFMVAANLANTAGVYMGGQNEDKNKSWDDYFKTIPQIESFSIHSENSIFFVFPSFLKIIIDVFVVVFSKASDGIDIILVTL